MAVWLIGFNYCNPRRPEICTGPARKSVSQNHEKKSAETKHHVSPTACSSTSEQLLTSAWTSAFHFDVASFTDNSFKQTSLCSREVRTFRMLFYIRHTLLPELLPQTKVKRNKCWVLPQRKNTPTFDSSTFRWS